MITNKQTKEIISNIEKTWAVCSDCNGYGITASVFKQGNMITQVHKPCTLCQGQGVNLLPEYVLATGINVADFTIGRGISNGAQHKFEGGGNSMPGAMTGDVIIVFDIKDSFEKFTRSGNNLLYKHNISLKDALCGGSFTLITMDKRTLNVSFSDVTTTSTIVIPNEGMVTDTTAGNLIINFDIEFPKLSDLQKKQLKECNIF